MSADNLPVHVPPAPSKEKALKTGKNRRWSHIKWRLRRLMKKVFGWVVIGTGMVFLAIGSIFALLPGHLGIPVMILGLIMVLKNAFWARRQFIRLKKKHPNWVMPLRKLLRRNPPVVSVAWHSLLKTERFILRRGRTLGAWRRRWFRKTRASAH